MFCTRCRYPLSQIESRQCPECGRRFDPADAKTYLHTATTMRGVLWHVGVGALAAGVFALVILLLFMLGSSVSVVLGFVGVLVGSALYNQTANFMAWAVIAHVGSYLLVGGITGFAVWVIRRRRIYRSVATTP